MLAIVAMAQIMELEFTDGRITVGNLAYSATFDQVPSQQQIISRILNPGQCMVVEGQIIAIRCPKRSKKAREVRVARAEATPTERPTEDPAESATQSEPLNEVAQQQPQGHEVIEERAPVRQHAPKSRRHRRARETATNESRPQHPPHSPPAAHSPPRQSSVPQRPPGHSYDVTDMHSYAVNILREHLEFASREITQLRNENLELHKAAKEAFRRELAQLEHARSVAALEREQRIYDSYMAGPAANSGGGQFGGAWGDAILAFDEMMPKGGAA